MTAGIIVVAALIAIVVVHELGHFVAARAVGIRVTRFFVFFPPKLWSVKRKGVEYGVGSIPAGGFVKMPGMFEPEGKDVHWRLEPAINDVIGGLSDSDLRLRICASFRSIEHAGDAHTIARYVRELIDEIGAIIEQDPVPVGSYEGAPKSLYRRKLRRLHKRLVDTVDECDAKAYWRAPLWRRMIVIAAGPAVNVVTAFLVLWIATTLFTPKLTASVGVVGVMAHSSAAAAHVQAGDRIVRWNGTKMGLSNAASLIERAESKPVKLLLRRDDGSTRTVRLVPHTLPDSGSKKYVGISVGPVNVHRVGWTRVSPLTAAHYTASDLWSTTVGTIKGFANVVTPQGRKQITTAVGFVEVAPQVQKAGELPRLIALISLAIGIVNLLPLLPLDGGHLLLGIVEWVRRGRRASRAVFERFSVVGIMLILMLFSIGLNNDIMG